MRNENEVTDDTSRRISSEVTNQFRRKIDELKREVNKQTMQSVNKAIYEAIIPSLQSCLFTKIAGLDEYGLNVQQIKQDHRM